MRRPALTTTVPAVLALTFAGAMASAAAEPANEAAGSTGTYQTERHGRPCTPRVEQLRDLGHGAVAFDVTGRGLVAGLVDTGVDPGDLNGDGEPESSQRAAYWFHGRPRLVPSGLASDVILDVTDSGWFLGQGFDPASAIYRSYVWRRGWRTVRLLDAPEGAQEVRARRMNERGQLAGTVQMPEGALPVLWQNPWSAPEVLPLGEGAGEGLARGINDQGQVVGFLIDDEPDLEIGPDWFDFDAAVWEPGASAPTKLADLGLDAVAWHINERGLIGGFVMYLPAPDAPRVYRAFATWKDGRLRQMETPPGLERGDVLLLGLSDGGWAAGLATREEDVVPPLGGPISQALLSTDLENVRLLPDLTGNPDPRTWEAVANGVDDRLNVVIGWATDGELRRAVVWHCASRLAVDPPDDPGTSSSSPLDAAPLAKDATRDPWALLRSLDGLER